MICNLNPKDSEKFKWAKGKEDIGCFRQRRPLCVCGRKHGKHEELEGARVAVGRKRCEVRPVYIKEPDSARPYGPH